MVCVKRVESASVDGVEADASRCHGAGLVGGAPGGETPRVDSVS